MKALNKKEIFYTDEINDDFAENITKEFKISDNFKYVHKNKFYNLCSNFLYFIIAKPIFYLWLKLKYHVHVYGKEKLKKLKGTGYFIYSNHTQNIVDAYTHQCLVFPQKGHIIADDSLYSLKGVKTIVSMLGAIPLPNNMIQSKNMADAISYYVKKGHVIVIFPEAHVWPYFNDVRNFLDTSFLFPVINDKPVVVTTTVYRERKIFKNRHPYFSIYISDPLYIRKDLSLKENQKYLRDQAYKLMKENVKKYNSYEYIKYTKKEEM